MIKGKRGEKNPDKDSNTYLIILFIIALLFLGGLFFREKITKIPFVKNITTIAEEKPHPLKLNPMTENLLIVFLGPPFTQAEWTSEEIILKIFIMLFFLLFFFNIIYSSSVFNKAVSFIISLSLVMILATTGTFNIILGVFQGFFGSGPIAVLFNISILIVIYFFLEKLIYPILREKRIEDYSQSLSEGVNNIVNQFKSLLRISESVSQTSREIGEDAI